MVVVLSKESKRSEIGLPNINYSLSDIKRKKREQKKHLDFRIDEEDN